MPSAPMADSFLSPHPTFTPPIHSPSPIKTPSTTTGVTTPANPTFLKSQTSPSPSTVSSSTPRQRLRPITRLLPTRTRHYTSSSPPATATATATAVAAATAAAAVVAAAAQTEGSDVASPVHDVRSRPYASLPLRKQRTRSSRSCSPSPRAGRKQRMARRFPKKVDVLQSGRDVYLQHLHRRRVNGDAPALSADVISEFFDHFQPFAYPQDDDEDDNGNGDGEEGNGRDYCGSAALPRMRRRGNADGKNAYSQTVESTEGLVDPIQDRKTNDSENVDILKTEQAATRASGVNSIDSVISTESDGKTLRGDRASNDEESMSEIRAEVAMLRRLLHSELREGRQVQEVRYAQLTDAVNEAVRLAVQLEGRLDALRVPAQSEREPRPYVVLLGVVADAVATVLLFVIAVFVARPVAGVKWCVERVRANIGIGGDGSGGGAEMWTGGRGVGGGGQRASRSWRLSGKDFDDPFLGTVAKRISFSASNDF